MSVGFSVTEVCSDTKTEGWERGAAHSHTKAQESVHSGSSLLLGYWTVPALLTRATQ